MSKSRRKVTVDTAKPVSDDSEKRKPSVFERLGPGGGQRKYDYEAERMDKSSYVEKCRNWLLTGSCSFGSKCKFLHGPYTAGANVPEARIRSSKRHESDNTDDIKLKLKSPRDKGNDRKRKNENSSTENRSHSKLKHEKEGKIKSTVVVKKPVEAGSEIDSEEPEEWSEDDSLKNLDFKEELTLMRKRQELQRALNNLPAPPEEQRENLTIEKKVRRHILPGEHSVRVSSSESGSIQSSPEPSSKQQSKKSLKPTMNPSSKKKDKKKHKASKSPLSKSSKNSSDQILKEKEKKRQISEERDVHHKVRMKKKKHKESLSEADNKSPDVPEPIRGGHKMHSPLFESSKSKLALSPKHDWQKAIKSSWALEEGECYPLSSKKSRRSRSPSSGEKSRHKKSLSPSLEKRSKHSPMNVLPSERDNVVEKLRKSRTRGITPPEKLVSSLSTSKDRSLSSDDERSAHSSIHDGEKRKNKKSRYPERVHTSRSSKSSKGSEDRLLYSESLESSRQNEWRNESPPPRERRDRRNRDFTPERTLKASRSGSREHEKMDRESKLSKKKEVGKSLEAGQDSRSDRKRQFKEDRLLPVCSPEVQDPNYTKPRRLLPDPTEPAINSSSRRGLSPKDSYNSCHSRSPSRQRRGEARDRSPFDVLQIRRKDIANDDYRHDEQPPATSPGRNRLLPDNNYFPENFDYSPSRQFIEHLNEDRRNDRFMGFRSESRGESRYSQQSERYPFEERRRYNEEPLPAGFEERTHYDSSRNRTNRDLYERDRYERVPQSNRSDSRYEEAKEPLVYDRNLPPDYREPSTEVWEIRGRGRGRVNPRSRGRQSETAGHRGRGYVPPQDDRLSGIARERPSRRSEWERHQEEYFGSEHVEWSDHRNERNLPLPTPSHENPRQEIHDIPELRRGRRPDSRDEWRNGRREAEELYERRPELGTGLLVTPDRIEMRPERWENRQPGEALRRPEIHKNDNKHEDRLDKRNLSPAEKERIDSRRKRPREQDADQSRSRSPSLKHHRENSPVDSFHSHSSVSEHRTDGGAASGGGREWMANRWPPPQPTDPLALRDNKEGGCSGDQGGQWPGMRQRSPLQKHHLMDKKRNKEWENNRSLRGEKDLLDKDGDRMKTKERDKMKEPDNQVLFPDNRMLINRKNRPKKKEKRKRSLSKSPSLDGKDRKRICRGISPKGPSHEDKDKLFPAPQQQNQELTFSDWSDDESADDILNRPDEPQEPVVPLLEAHIKEDRFKHNPGRGAFMNQPIRQLHNPKEEYRMWQPHKERNSRYHWEKPNLSTQPRLPLGRTFLERHHKDMVNDMCFRMKPDHLPRLLPDPEPMSDLRPPMDSSNHGNVVDMMPVIKQPLLGDAPGCVPLHSLTNMPMATPPINPMLLQNLLSMPHNMGHPMPMNTLGPPMPPVNQASFAAASAAAAVAAVAAASNTTPLASSTATTTTASTVNTATPTNVATPTSRANNNNNNNSDINGIDLDSAGMQYEEISSEEESMEGELDLELLGVGGDKKKKKSIVDVLNIDWSHVMQTNRPKLSEKSGSALHRFWPGKIFSKIGVSRQFAGEELFQKLQELCQKQLQVEQQPPKTQTATEENEETKTEKGEETLKDTNSSEVIPSVNETNKFQFKNNIAALHMAIVKKTKERANLVHDVGSYRRALCARRDLEMRRQLCQVDKSLEQTNIYPNQLIDSDLCKLSVQLFKQGHENSLKKEPLHTKPIPCSS